MLSLAKDASQEDTIELSDMVIEHSTIVTEMFTILIDHEVQDLDMARLLGHVIDLATKWELDLVLLTIRQQLQLELATSGTIDMPFQWQLAAKLGMNGTMSQIIDRHGEWTWGDDCDDDPSELTDGPMKSDPFQCHDYRKWGNSGDHQRLPNAPVLDPGGMTLIEYCQIPPLVHWALARSTYLVHPNSRRLWSRIAEKFKAIMDSVGAYASLDLDPRQGNIPSAGLLTAPEEKGCRGRKRKAEESE